MQELDSSEKQWVEVCGQIDKLDKFFPLGSVAMTRAREAQAAAIARGMSCLITWPTEPSFAVSHPLTGAAACGRHSMSCLLCVPIRCRCCIWLLPLPDCVLLLFLHVMQKLPADHSQYQMCCTNLCLADRRVATSVCSIHGTSSN